ncbi:hypothetical protein M1349_01720, partial [Patescibacteria group bacterium]|nr:hypothetical protein [Patescibacteria group bacterium]
VCDVLSGLVGQALKLSSGEAPNNKDLVRQEVLNTLETEMKKKIAGNLTVNNPNYFSIWIIDWDKSKRPGHGQETQPQP